MDVMGERQHSRQIYRLNHLGPVVFSGPNWVALTVASSAACRFPLLYEGYAARLVTGHADARHQSTRQGRPGRSATTCCLLMMWCTLHSMVLRDNLQRDCRFVSSSCCSTSSPQCCSPSDAGNRRRGCGMAATAPYQRPPYKQCYGSSVVTDAHHRAQLSANPPAAEAECVCCATSCQSEPDQL